MTGRVTLNSGNLRKKVSASADLRYLCVDKQFNEARDVHSGPFIFDLNTGLEIKTGGAEVLTPVSAKGRVLLAMLCLSESKSCTRDWLVRHLWGSRAIEQGRVSLRQELFGLKRLLNKDVELLLIDSQHVALNAALVRIAPIVSAASFLDWVQIPGEPQCAAWVRDMKRATLMFDANSSRSARAVVEIEARDSSQTNLTAGVSLALQSALAEFLSDAGGVSVVRSDPGAINLPDVKLVCRVYQLGDELRISLELMCPDSGMITSPLTHRMSLDYARQANLPVLIDQIANEGTDFTLNALVAMSDRIGSEPFQAAKSAVAGVRALFSRHRDGLSLAQGHLDRAVQLSDSSTFLAWRAYLGALSAEELGPEKHQEIRASSRADIEAARAAEPENGIVAALGSHVYGFVLNNFDMAADCLRDAIRLRPSHVMTQDAAALYSFYTGDLVAARQAAMKAEYFGRHLPFQYVFSTSMLMVETLAGNFQAGVYHGEQAMTLAPKQDAKAYPPTLRYLGICYAQLGEAEKAQDVFRLLDEAEGVLTRQSLRNGAYLMPSEESRALLIDSLKRLGR